MAKGKYKRKRLNKIRRKILIQDTSLPVKVKNILNTVNIHSLYDLDTFPDEELGKIPGIGEKYSAQIKELRNKQ